MPLEPYPNALIERLTGSIAQLEMIDQEIEADDTIMRLAVLAAIAHLAELRNILRPGDKPDGVVVGNLILAVEELTKAVYRMQVRLGGHALDPSMLDPRGRS